MHLAKGVFLRSVMQLVLTYPTRDSHLYRWGNLDNMDYSVVRIPENVPTPKY